MAGSGEKFERITIIIAGVASLLATLISIVSIWLQTKNYRKPLLQRYVVRILLMVPIYSIASWTSMVSHKAAFVLDPIRDVYEAFTIYTFFQLMINYLSGERALIIMTHGREPVNHLWPLNHVLPRVDISDPHTFLAIKRGILQYAWLKPILGLAAIIMKATGTYQEGYISLTSGYLWSGIFYNISVTVSLYALGLFWVCMHDDLKPFRPVPKFLCVKLVIFASYWQGFALAILVWLGAIPSFSGYKPDKVAAAIQDFLICLEMVPFACLHLYAFNWRDFADNRIASARMPVRYACRDAFGIRDLIEDSKETFRGDKYGYRLFDSGDKIMAHEASKSRLARLKDGMRYEKGGKAKYWIPRPEEINQTTPLLGANGGASSSRRSNSTSPHHDLDELILDPDEEILYDKARKLEFGDWNYPVITAAESAVARHMTPRPDLYQHTPTGSFYNHSSRGGSSPSINPATPLGRRKKEAPEGPQLDATDKKGKKNSKASSSAKQSHGLDPLEIAYGPIVGTNPEITESDFEVDLEQGQNKPQDEAVHEPRSTSPTLNHAANRNEADEEEEEDDPSPTFSIGEDEDEFRNVWDK